MHFELMMSSSNFREADKSLVAYNLVKPLDACAMARQTSHQIIAEFLDETFEGNVVEVDFALCEMSYNYTPI